MFEVVICLVNTCFVHPYRHGPQAVHGMVAQKEDNQKHPDREKDQDGQQKVISSKVCDATCIGDHAYGSQNPRGQGAHDGCCQIRVEAQCQVLCPAAGTPTMAHKNVYVLDTGRRLEDARSGLKHLLLGGNLCRAKATCTEKTWQTL